MNKDRMFWKKDIWDHVNSDEHRAACPSRQQNLKFNTITHPSSNKHEQVRSTKFKDGAETT